MNDKINLQQNPQHYTVEVSRPKKIVRHDISDEELDILCRGATGHRLEALWVSLGASISSAPSAVPALVKKWRGVKSGEDIIPYSIPGVDLIHILIFVAGCVTAGYIFLVLGISDTSSEKLRLKIKARASDHSS